MPVKITGNNVFVEPPKSVLTNLLGAPKTARGIHCCPNYFSTSFGRPAPVYCEECVYLYTHLTAWRFYVNYLCY